ncbi:MAG: magnesium/cobalt transporter CorA [Caldilineaceae bacterium]|nr:magnesium/cobalt transporter CorA [Caldilineaceae bacterium]
MIRVLYRHSSGTILTELSDAEIKRALGERGSYIWVDLEDATPEEFQRMLVDTFSFHSLAVDDVINDVHSPKLDNYERYLFLVLHTLGEGDEPMDIHTYEMDAFLGADYLVTIHAEPRPAIADMWKADYHRDDGLARGPSYVLYKVLDAQIDSYVPLLDHLDDRLEELGDTIFLQGDHIEEHTILNELLTAKSSALRAERILLRQRETVGLLARSSYPVVPADMRIYFNDVYDHLVRLNDLAGSLRDLAGTTIDTYLALVNNRTNDVMRILTLVSTLFLPLTFLTGVYGMNFEFMPELGWPWAYPIAWLLFIASAGIMIYWFRRQKWI